MRPLLHPALSCVRRDATTLQIGTTPGRAVVLGGLGQVELAVLRAMDGHTDLTTLRSLAAAAGDASAIADRLVELLFSAGVAVDRDKYQAAGVRPEHEPDRASVGLIDRSPDGGHGTFARRARRYVQVVGAGRVGASVARLLVAGGIGEVDVDDQNLVTPADIAPAGHAAAAVGLARDRSLRPQLTAAPAIQVTDRAGPDFVVFAPYSGLDHIPLADSMLRSGVPHLLVQVTEVTGVVGPLVIPGASACLRCLDMHRTDRDRAWPAIRDQAARKPAAAPACDVSLATTVAGLASGQVLAYLDGYDVAAIGGTIEMELPYGMPRRRSWQAHPDCGCMWTDPATIESETAE